MLKLNKDKLKRRVVQALELPKDVVLGMAQVTVTGDEEVAVSNHKGLLEYSSGFVRLGTILGGLKIFGTNLILREITAEVVIISGKIDKIFWEEK
ncbi:MAG: sporulation protein YqfC [Defluviitaleaceae bacterium]|nr:sporulation protein YqfC [Defluviitaleaceae bacterium]